MDTENRLSRSLAEVPPVPDEIEESIMRSLRRAKRARRGWMAAAAAVVLFVTGALYLGMDAGAGRFADGPDASSTSESAALEEGLQYVSDYFNGAGIDEEVAQYALLDDVSLE